MSLRPNEKTHVRRNSHKVAVDAEQSRRRRESNLVEIRKSRREEILKKKRLHVTQEAPQGSPLPSSDSIDKMLRNLIGLVAGVSSDDPLLQLESLKQFRLILSTSKNPPIGVVIESGVVRRFVEILNKDDSPWLQLEAAWILTNIASGTRKHTEVVIDHGAVPIFIKLLASPHEDVREQAVWALGNVAGDSPQCRDYVLECGAMMPLLAQLNKHSTLSMITNATWTLSNFCRGKPKPAFEQVSPALPVLERLIRSNDEEVLADACWSLSFMSDGGEEEIQSVIEAGVVPRLVELLLHPCPSVVSPALRSIGNIVSGNTQQTQCVINCGALPILSKLLTQYYKKSIKRDVCWTIANITAGIKEHIQLVIDATMIPSLVHLAQYAEFDIKKEALCAISNATRGGSHEQVKYLVEQSCIKPLCDILVCQDPSVISVCLDGLENILKVGEVENSTGGQRNYSQLIEDAEGIEKIEKLQSNDNNEIYEKAVKILETYWVEEDDEEAQQEDDGGDDCSHLGIQFGRKRIQVPHGGFNFG
uniref:Importin subunit alpha n=2 Tax=Brassica campestris TaxID=3711 RepID=M4DVV5_BRACM